MIAYLEHFVPEHDPGSRPDSNAASRILNALNQLHGSAARDFGGMKSTKSLTFVCPSCVDNVATAVKLAARWPNLTVLRWCLKLGLWFAPLEWRECRLGIKLLRLAPIIEALFTDAAFALELVEWTALALRRDGVGEGWKGLVYALRGDYDSESTLGKIRSFVEVDFVGFGAIVTEFGCRETKDKKEENKLYPICHSG